METLLHNIDIVMSAVALVFSTIALVISLRNRQRPSPSSTENEQAAPTPGAQLMVNLVKMPSVLEHGAVSQDYRFWISNIGTGPALDVTFKVELDEDVLFQQEYNEKFPVAVMQPGDRIELCSRIGIDTPREFRTLVHWDDGSGFESVQEFWISKEIGAESTLWANA